jgi:hypothetical protein
MRAVAKQLVCGTLQAVHASPSGWWISRLLADFHALRPDFSPPELFPPPAPLTAPVLAWSVGDKSPPQYVKTPMGFARAQSEGLPCTEERF